MFDNTQEPFWNKKEVSRRAKYITKQFENLLLLDNFDINTATDCVDSWRTSQETRKKLEVRVKKHLQTCPRLKMSTIGSSHRLFEPVENEESGDDEDSIVEGM